ncbi:MAG: polysaccharide biosynthesis C-terminal domain-containing protein, partial [Clostridia bacterium]|nr:polysaccharide biosynthesis C-terminal domain-containing protein [Clostridia bacterium]
VLFKSEYISFIFSDERCMALLMIMIPALAFTSVYAVIRGAFWGNTQFLTYSTIELLEEAVMLITGIVLVNRATDALSGIQRAGYAVLISYLFSFAVSVAVYFIKGGRLSSPERTLKPLLNSSAPITAMRTATTLIGTSISLILPARLVFYGATSAYALQEFGKVYGMAFPLIFMPSSLIGSLALVLVPELTDNYYSGKYLTLKNNIEKAIKFSALIACSIMPVFLSVGKEISVFLYSDESVGNYIIKAAAVMLPLSLSIITSSMLNSLNKEKQTLASFFIGASALIICILFLPSIIGINALIIGMILYYGINSCINLRLLEKASPVKPKCLLYVVKATLLVFPSAFFGSQLNSVLKLKFNLLTSLSLTIIAVVAFESALLIIFGLLEIPSHTKKRFKGLTSDKIGKRINKRA